MISTYRRVNTPSAHQPYLLTYTFSNHRKVNDPPLFDCDKQSTLIACWQPLYSSAPYPGQCQFRTKAVDPKVNVRPRLRSTWLVYHHEKTMLSNIHKPGSCLWTIVLSIAVIHAVKEATQDAISPLPISSPPSLILGFNSLVWEEPAQMKLEVHDLIQNIDGYCRLPG